MLVKCIEKDGHKLPFDDSELGSYWKSQNFPYLIIDKNYVVYALSLHLGYTWYFICEDEEDHHPMWRPSPLFDVVNGQLSKYWIYSYKTYEDGSIDTILAYPEYAQDPCRYFDRLIDGYEEEEKIYKSYKKLMDLEFPNPEIQESATIGDDKRLMCLKCIEAWESTSTDGMVVCPMCKTMYHNPRYQ